MPAYFSPAGRVGVFIDMIERNLKRGLEQDMARIEEGLQASVKQSVDRLEHTVRRDFEQALAKFSMQITAAIREHDEPKGKRRF